jgi:membrane glycosyltransferase
MTVVLLPKVLSLADIALDHERRRAFGGLTRTFASTVAETIFSTLHAPLQMLWHSRFVVTILMGRGVHWGSQKRVADGTAWSTGFQRLWVHTAVGLLWGGLVWWLDPGTFWWFVPVFAGMVLAIPLSVLTSRSSIGVRARRMGLFLTPEETSPPPELDTLRARVALQASVAEAAVQPQGAGLAQIVLDPYVNAIHVSLLREKKLNPEYAEAMTRMGAGSAEVRALGERLLNEGPDALESNQKIQIMTDADVMSWLHRQVWLRPGDTLAASWQSGMRQYSR